MNQLIKYSGGVLPSDNVNTASAVVERGVNGEILVSGVNAGTQPAGVPTSAYVANDGSCWISSDLTTTTASLTSSSRQIQRCDTTAGTYTITLPPAATSSKQFFTFLKIDAAANIVTLKGNGAENINVGATQANTTTLAATRGSKVNLWCDGAAWWAV